MVTVIGCKKSKNSQDEEFISLILQGDVDLALSKQTGRWYATARKTIISSTFDERTAETLIGKKLPGSIEKVEVEPYKYVVPETGEEIELNYSWVYSPESKTVEEEVFQR